MKLKDLLPLIGNCHVTIWSKDKEGKMRVIARGFSRIESNFAKQTQKSVTAIRSAYDNSLSIIVE